MSTLKEFAFSVELADVDEITEELSNALYAAGCDDALVSSCNGKVVVEFDRDATSLSEALNSGIQSIRKAGFRVASVRERVDGADDCNNVPLSNSHERS